MILFKKARQSALFDIANSKVISDLVFSFSNQSQTETNFWLNSLTNNKKDKGIRELIIGSDIAMIRPVIKSGFVPEALIYGFEKTGYKKISPHLNKKGRVDVKTKDMVKLFSD